MISRGALDNSRDASDLSGPCGARPAPRLPGLRAAGSPEGVGPNAAPSASAPARPAPTANLDEAAARLSNAAGSPARAYSTFDFGREKDPTARSVLVPKDRARGVLAKVRGEIAPGLVAFIGATQWLGDEKFEDMDEIVVAPGRTQFDILRVARSDAVNYDMDTEKLVEKLTEYDLQFGIDILHAETDTIEFKIKKLPADLRAFCKDLYAFCPDIVDQGVGTVERLEQAVREAQEVLLCWDCVPAIHGRLPHEVSPRSAVE